MRNLRRIHIPVLLLATSILILSSCAPLNVGESQRPKYYVLNSLYAAEAPVSPMAEMKTVSIGVGPVRFPRHLDRKEIVTRTGDNEVTMDEFALWAGPLSENFNLVLAENLSVLLATKQVAIFPWRSQYPIKYQVVVHVTRFDGQQGEEALLRVRWLIMDEDSKDILHKDQATYKKKAGGGSMEALVAAKSEALEAFSRDVAREVIALEKTKR